MTEKLYVAEEHIWVTADRSRAVDVSDPDAALLHTPTGHSMPFEEAKRLGLIKPAKKRSTAKEKK